MSLNDNPIFLTQKRLVHRGGVLAPILIAALISLSLLAGLIAYLVSPLNFDFSSAQDAGRLFYGWTIGVEILILVFMGFGRISQALANERKTGLWDSNRLTPLKPAELIIGYWLGSPLREFYMAAVMAGIGLLIVLLSGLPITLWLGTQVLILSTTLFVGLGSVLIGMAISRPQNAYAVFGFIFLIPISMVSPSHILVNFLLPVYGIGSLFYGDIDTNDEMAQQWKITPDVFGIHIPAILLSLGLQLIVGFFLWRAVTRKVANPFRPALMRWEIIALFAILVMVQNGLIWSFWTSNFRPNLSFTNPGHDLMLAAVHCGTLLLGVTVLASASPLPESVRIEALRARETRLGVIFSRSAISLALILTVIGLMGLLTQCLFSLADSWKVLVIAGGNLLDCFLVFSLLLEFCRLNFKRRAIGFAALWLFVLCILPFILAGVFTNSVFARFSLFSPGILALFPNNPPALGLSSYNPSDAQSDYLNNLIMIVLVHFAIVVLLFFMWRREWLKLLARASADQK